MNFGMITLNQTIRTVQNYAIWIQTVLSLVLKHVENDVANDVEKRFDTSNYVVN